MGRARLQTIDRIVILLDTQALVWLFEANPRLGTRARAIIEKERIDGGALIPAISVGSSDAG